MRRATNVYPKTHLNKNQTDTVETNYIARSSDRQINQETMQSFATYERQKKTLRWKTVERKREGRRIVFEKKVEKTTWKHNLRKVDYRDNLLGRSMFSQNLGRSMFKQNLSSKPENTLCPRN